MSAGWYHQEEVVASVGSEEPSDTSSSEQREGEGGSNRAVFRHSAVGTGTFSLLDFTLPWLLLTALVSGRLNQELCPSMYLPWHPGQGAGFRASSTGRNSPCSREFCAPWGLLQTLPFAKGNATLLGKPGSQGEAVPGCGAGAAGFWQSADHVQSGSPGVRNGLLSPAI